MVGYGKFWAHSYSLLPAAPKHRRAANTGLGTRLGNLKLFAS